MADTINILDGTSFVTSDNRGDISGTPDHPHGFFAFDTRFLSRWMMTVDGRPLSSLSTDDLAYNAAQFFLAPSTGTTYIDAPLSVMRRRHVGRGMLEQISIVNHSQERKEMVLELQLGADFADLFEVKDALEKKGESYTRVDPDRLVLGYKREEFTRETHIWAGPDAQIAPTSITYNVALEPHGEWSTELRVTPVIPGSTGWDAPTTSVTDPGADPDLDLSQWTAEAPRIRSDWRPIERIYERSIIDLAALRFDLPRSQWQKMPAAGLPWFMAAFGRDSLITSYQALPFVPSLAESTLRTLASFQGTRLDNFRDEEPGKILHELRFGELTAFEERPHSPYFGSADSTTLWLILLDEYERWSGRVDVVRELEPSARAALAWIDAFGDRDGDGYIEYERRNTDTGLENQCWKDSWDSIAFSNGELAPLPRATCELQGYAYDAKMRCARLAREIWGDPAFAAKLEEEAAALKARFNRDFWINKRGGYYALALDGQKRQVDALTSNLGHLLWSGIVDDDKAPQVVAQLMGDELFSGWGVRTMSTGDARYNPIGYHVGTVWPHDNSIVAMGLRRYGYTNEAARIADGILEAATLFRDRLPEAFAGYPRTLTKYPVEYPTACSPQAWATGAPLLLLTAMLGMEPAGARLHSAPVLPARIQQLDLANVPGRWGRESVGADAADTIMAALGSAAAEAPGSISELFERLDKRVGSVAGRTEKTSIRFDLGNGESWRVAVDQGRLEVGKSTEDADCVIETTEQTLRDLLSGRQKAQTAALSGKVKVKGDVAIAAKIGTLF